MALGLRSGMVYKLVLVVSLAGNLVLSIVWVLEKSKSDKCTDLVSELTERARNSEKKLTERARISEEKLVALASKKPAMPIRISFRKAMIAKGLVAQFTNMSGRSLAIAASFSNPTLGETKSFRVDLDSNPATFYEIGANEGWTLASGDLIEVKHADYETMKAKTP